MSKIQEELLTKTGLVAPRSEAERPKFLSNVLKAVNKLSNPQFDKLSKASQSWANKAADYFDNNKPLPDFGDYTPSKPDKPEPSRKATASAAAPKAKPVEDKKADAPKLRKLTDGAPTLLKQMILKNPDLTTTEIVDALKKQGVKVSPLYVQTQRNDFRHSIRVMQHAKLLTKSFNV